ncbi:MAG TPA: phosphate ABC transporter substrate-binding protein PstS [Elusimicrobiota bacterium]|jgi:phosphate transport system substrate-binding protein|nr:phosphate ABC transporter substrate-binding protein PstS [Elusimicrobiota bacterium]
MNIRKIAAAILVAAMSGGAAFAEGAIALNGAGATFPYPIYSKWFDKYHEAHPDVQINYQSIGSGGGIRQVTEKTVDFGATDGPMSDEQLAKAGGGVLHIPTVLGGVVPIYNVPGVDLKLSGPVLADIFQGKIKAWNDAALKALNPGAALPDAPITVVHRSDGSGTSFCFTDYLSKVSPEWLKAVGKGTAVSWPVGLGGKGNEGVAGLVKQTPNSIGYVELIYAKQNNIEYAAVRNKAGKFVKADLDSVTAAAAGAAKNMPKDFRVSITDAAGEKTYPISTFTWLLIFEKSDAAKAKTVKDFLGWMLKEGQPMAPALGYAPLPPQVKSQVEKTLGKIRPSA